MKNLAQQVQAEPSGQPANSTLSRRRLFAGATGIGAAAVAATILPGAIKDIGPVAPSKVAPLKGGGYMLSEHVKQYYKSALI